jgi:hypothetical protein
MRFVTVIFAALVWAAGAAQAQDRNCNEPSGTGNLSNIALGVVIAPRASFIANETETAGCPSADAKCQKKAFVVAQNLVLFDSRTAKTGYLCATYIGKTGRETDGWLALADVKPVAAPTPDWIGTWKRDTSADIEIIRKSAATADLSGNATWGQGAGTNVGEISAIIDPRQNVQGFGLASDGQTQTAYGKGDPQECAVILKQLGPYLFASDNSYCGGMNVTFSGIYTRR